MADETNHSELIALFTGVTGVEGDRAKFYLESAAWKLDVALASFYDEDETSTGTAFKDQLPTPEASSKAQPPVKPNTHKKYGTISGLSSGSTESDEEGQAYYAGGSERGAGQQVIGPPLKKPSADKFVKDMFKAAKEHGAEEVSVDTSPAIAVSRPVFRGTGYRLGDSDGPLETVSGLEEPKKEANMLLKLWKNGFSIDDGELREFDNPENKQFLDSVRNGEVPQELTRLAKGGIVNLNMEDHRNEDYVKPKIVMKPFTGHGHTLGSPSPVILTEASSEAVKISGDCNVKLDESKPVTTLQIRLSNGKRLVAKFNHSHTVADVHHHIESSYPHFVNTEFVLMTTFPKKDLTDETSSLQELGLLNSVLVQRLI